MTTDITELALLVSKAKASVFTLEYISQFEPADIDSDDVDLRFEVDDMDVGTNVSIVDECGQAAKVIGALVEALEKAQQQNISDFEIKARLCKESNSLHDRLREAEKRIAELESRTVKLPKRSVGEVMHMSGFSRDYAEGWCAGNDNAIHEMRVAGVNVIEGEQNNG
ncbi:ead/Ea22-like family protein [Klebsiella aerogenes]|uniref:ead/Ea22-like family protein n=1 Tax=Klebsiella aerogenes TaxID=548 RepID=UPI000A7F080B|nr:ead/Ea22-like family protein [Klebsiella aerogenes]